MNGRQYKRCLTCMAAWKRVKYWQDPSERERRRVANAAYRARKNILDSTPEPVL